MLGWNDAPLVPPAPPVNEDVPGWGNAVWGDEAVDEQVLQPPAPKQDQVSIVIDQLEGSVSVDQPESDFQHVPPPDLQQHQVFEGNQLAIVPYQPPVVHYHEIFIGMARIVAGPSLPPEMI